MVEFGASIKLDSASAIEQMRKFADRTTAASKALVKFQKETKATAQGGGANVFRKLINSSQRANQQMLKSIALIHSQGKAYSKLSDEEKKLVNTSDKLNRKYDESAAIERKLVTIRKELQIVTTAGLKTQKAADAIYDAHALKLSKTTKAYKENIAAKKNLVQAQKRESSAIDAARSKWDKQYIAKKRIAKVTKELDIVLKAGGITQRQHNALLKKSTREANRTAASTAKLTSRYGALAKGARIVSIASRLMLGAYVAVRAVKMFTDFERTAEAVQLLSQKLTFLTGDSGGYKTLFAMTQQVGIEMKSASKIITRFAVVTNRAFDTETMADWSSTLIRSARATGTSTQEMTGALIQITQAMSAGRLMGDEYRSVTENLPLLTVALRDMFKDSTLSLKELSSQGLLTNDVMIEAFGKLKVMLEGFPDTTNTIDAAIGRLSSSWDNFVANVADTTIVKSSLNAISGLLNEVNIRMQLRSKISQREDESKAFKVVQEHEAKIKRLNSELEEERRKRDFADNATTRVYIGDRGDPDRVSRAIAAENKLYREQKVLVDAVNAATASKEKKELATAKAKAEADRDRVHKAELKVEALIAEVENGSGIEKLNRDTKLLLNRIESKLKLYKKGEAGGFDEATAKRLSDRVLKDSQDKANKIYKKEIDSQLRLKGFTTKNNIDKIREELNTTGKIRAIKLKHIKDVEAIRSAEQARAFAKGKGLSGEELDNISDTTKKAASELITKLDAKKLADIREHFNSVTQSITSVGVAAKATTARLKGDITAALGLDKAKTVDAYNKSVATLEIKLKALIGTEDELAKKGLTINSIRESELKTLKALQEAQSEKLEEDFDTRLENKFNSGAAAVRQYNKDIIELNAAKERLILTDREYVRQLDLLNDAMNDSSNLYKAQSGELSDFEQVTLGMQKGLKDFKKSAKTTFEVAAESSTKFMDGLVDSIVIGGEEGKKAFKDMAISIIQDIERMILKRMAYQALEQLGFDTGMSSGSSTGGSSGGGGLFGGGGGGLLGGVISNFFGGGGSAVPSDLNAMNINLPFAKGGMSSGPGISAYSNTVVNKPTIFPFAKGTGIMGEAGEEAIMPLTRLPNGDLGVGVSGGSDSGKKTTQIIQHINFHVSGNLDKKSQQQAAQAMLNTASRFAERNN